MEIYIECEFNKEELYIHLCDKVLYSLINEGWEVIDERIFFDNDELAKHYKLKRNINL